MALTVLATFWNESYWLDACLKELDKIDPDYLVLCDGCFDPKEKSPHSTDGTREMLLDFTAAKNNSVVVNPVRHKRPAAILHVMRELGKLHRVAPMKQLTKALIKGIRTEEYRINQALTFNLMLRMSPFASAGNWLMTYDADQFYCDKLIDAMQSLRPNEKFDVLGSRELTFFEDLNSFTEDHEKRWFNNLPHKIYNETTILPTRGVARLNNEAVRRADLGYFSSLIQGYQSEPRLVGNVYHYKHFNIDRAEAGYRVGDRKKPVLENYSFHPFHGTHPAYVLDAVSADKGT